MDLVIENNLEIPRPSEEERKISAEEKLTMMDVGERLRKAAPGIAIIDNDFSLKTKEYELGMGGKEPGRIPDESIKLLEDLKNSGWEVLVVSNQPKDGHQVARLIKGVTRGKYPIFPDSIREVLGKSGVEGGGKDFLWHKYKNSPEGVTNTANWITENIEKVLGQIYFVGDRESDVDFAKRVESDLKLRGVNRQVNILRVKGLDLPKGLKGLERFIP